MPDAGELAPVLDAAREQLSRLCDRLRTAPESRLTRHDDRLGGRSLAEAVYEVAQWAATMQGITAAVPTVHPLSSGDLLAVVGREFLDSLATQLANSEPAGSGRDGLAQALEQWHQRVDQLRVVV